LVRKRFVLLTPEEHVRQLCLLWLTKAGGYSLARIAVEKKLEVNGNIYRFDILIYDESVKPFLLIECKAPQVPLTQSVFDQAARYNYELNAPYFLVTNGAETFCCATNAEQKKFSFLEQLP
jgi:type I site-specific restriction endonuclease